MARIKVFIVDDHAILRDGLKVLASLSNNIEIVGEASNGEEAIRGVAESQPDIVLMDVVMPIMDGIEATRLITRAFPRVKVLMLSQHSDSKYVLSSVKAGARGYILKRALSSDLVSGIEVAYKQGYYFHPSVARSVIKDYFSFPRGQ
jgi:DNA-binding NarL/FixJ family response regulator